MIKAILSDCDGLLVDTEPLYYEANLEYFSKKDFTYTDEIHRALTGKRFENWIKKFYTGPESGEQLLQERNEIFYRLMQEKVSFCPGAEAFLRMAHDNFHLALVTSSPRSYVEELFELLPMTEFFDTIVTGDMVTIGKPDPECYLKAAKELDVLPEECVVFEDAPGGVEAGKAAGMTVVAVPSMYVKNDPMFGNADLIVGSLNEITVETISQW